MPSYHLLDAAKVSYNMQKALIMNPVYESLYQGQSKELLSVIAPYLFQYESGSNFDIWLQEHYGESWGVGVVSDAPMNVLYKHFRKFLLVKTDDGKELYFRFYDPRVLRTFLPTCDTNQLMEFFGPVQQFIAEDPAQKRTLFFEYKGGRLETREEKILYISDTEF